MSSEESTPAVQGYASTDLINKLLAKLKTESGDYKRNQKTSLAIHGQSGVIYDALVAIIKKIVAIDLTGTSIPDWDDYEQSETGITGLEDYLLQLYFDSHDLPSILSKDNEKDLPAAIAFVQKWKVDSENLVSKTEGLNTLAFPTSAPAKPLVKDTDFKEKLLKGQREDHRETVKSIIVDINKSSLQDTDITGINTGDKYVQDVKDGVKSLFDELEKEIPADFDFSENKATGTVVAGVMLLQVPFLINELPGNTAKVDEHFKSLKVWGAAKKFAEDLLTFLKAVKTESLENLQTKYDAFVEVLNAASLGPWIPQILSMMRLSANVRRPFYGRSVALVRIWYTLNKSESGPMATEDKKDDRKALREAIQATIDAITKAKGDITSFIALEDAKIEAVGKSYAAVFATVKGMITKYGEEGQAATLEGYYNTALATDEKHLNEFMAKKSFLKAIAAATTPTESGASGGGTSDASKN